MSARVSAVALLVVAACTPAPPPAPPKLPPLKIAAASDLALAFPEIAKGYTQETGQEVSLSFGASGLLAKQIEEGAPFEVFAAASVAFADQVIAKSKCDRASRTIFATGKLVLFIPKGAAPAELRELEDERWKKVAIANPEHAPYGRAAKEALTSAGIWDAVEPKLVYGENVQQALKYAQSGNVDAAIVSHSLLVGLGEGAAMPIPSTTHLPLEQTIVVCGEGGVRAGRFITYLSTPSARRVLEGYGLTPPPLVQ